MSEGKLSKFLSVVIVLNSDDNFEKEIFEKLISVLTYRVDDFELVIVDNSSSNRLFKSLKRVTQEDCLPNIQVYRLANTVDYLVAKWAGIENSIGDYVISCEIENLDEYVIEKLIENINDLNEIILFKNKNKQIRFAKDLIYSALNKITSTMTKIELNKYSSESISVSRRVINYLLQFENPEIHLRNVHTVKGFRKTFIYLKNKKLKKKNLKNSISRGFNIVTNLSNAPIRLANIIASIAAVFSFTYSIYIVLVWILSENVVPGWVSLSMQISTLFFLNSLVLLLMSEYILKIGKRNYKYNKYYIIDEINSKNITRKGKLNIDTNI